jgi:hypothetical protein
MLALAMSCQSVYLTGHPLIRKKLRLIFNYSAYTLLIALSAHALPSAFCYDDVGCLFSFCSLYFVQAQAGHVDS